MLPFLPCGTAATFQESLITATFPVRLSGHRGLWPNRHLVAVFSHDARLEFIKHRAICLVAINNVTLCYLYV